MNMNTNGAVAENVLFLLFSIENIFKSPQRNWWDFLLETFHSIANKFNVEKPMLLAEQVRKLTFSG
jgi:hypothetical protein